MTGLTILESQTSTSISQSKGIDCSKNSISLEVHSKTAMVTLMFDPLAWLGFRTVAQ